MIDRGDFGLKDTLLIKNIDSSKRYMNYGISGVLENDDKQNTCENFTAKIKESEDKIDTIMGVIETFAS